MDLNEFIDYSRGEETHSQNLQDQFALFVKEKLNPKGKGFFVEFGAGCSIDSSNSWLLENVYEWDGILAEPNPDFHEDLMRHRRVPIVFDAVSDNSVDNIPFIKTYDPVLSTIKGYGNDDEHAKAREGGIEISVNTVTLYEMLNDMKSPKLIDYVSVDTEGSEYDILKKFFEENKNEYTINCFTVEHNYNETIRNKIKTLMENNGYVNVLRDVSRWDDFYVRKGEWLETENEEFIYRT